MKNLPNKLQEMKITDIAIPGSHDSGTYSLSKDEIYVNIFTKKVCRDLIPSAYEDNERFYVRSYPCHND